MTVEKKDLDWGNLDFSYRKTDYSYVSNYKDGAWDEGALTTDHSITLSECAGRLAMMTAYSVLLPPIMKNPTIIR